MVIYYILLSNNIVTGYKYRHGYKIITDSNQLRDTLLVVEICSGVYTAHAHIVDCAYTVTILVHIA